MCANLYVSQHVGGISLACTYQNCIWVRGLRWPRVINANIMVSLRTTSSRLASPFPHLSSPYFAFLSNLTFERRQRCIFTPGFRCLCDVGRVPIWTDCWLKLGVSPLLHDLLCIQLFIQRIYWSFLACQCLHRIIVRIYYWFPMIEA